MISLDVQGCNEGGPNFIVNRNQTLSMAEEFYGIRRISFI